MMIRHLPPARTLCYLGAILILAGLGVVSLACSAPVQPPATGAPHPAAAVSAPTTH